MKIITKKEFEETLIAASGNDKNKVIQAILQLKVDEALDILTEDWTPKTPLRNMWGTYKKKYGIAVKTRTKINKDGWVVLRIK